MSRALVTTESKAVIISIDSTSVLKKRFGAAFTKIVEELASALPRFSLDVVGVCASYLACGFAAAGVEPICLFKITHYEDRDCEPHQLRPFQWCIFSLAQAPDGSIFVGDDQTVMIFKEDGRFVSRIAQTHFKSTITGICFDDGEAFISNFSGNCVVVTDMQGNVKRSFGTHGSSAGELDGPWGISTDRKGNFFITEYANNRITVMKRDGTLVKTFGARGDGDGQFTHAACMAFDFAENELFVTDSSNSRVQVFNLEGKYQRQFGSKQSELPHFSYPVPIALDQNNNLLVGDETSKIQVLKRDGTIVTSFGTRLNRDAPQVAIHSADVSAHALARVQFDRPRGLCVCDDGRILVGDFSCRVQVLAFPA